MAVISALNVYPVKGCKGITVPEIELAETGLRFDRHWVVTDEDGRFVTQRELPRMALISTILDSESLVLNAPEMEPLVLPVLQIGERVSVTVWRDRCFGFDQGTAAAAWFSAFLSTPACGSFASIHPLGAAATQLLPMASRPGPSSPTDLPF